MQQNRDASSIYNDLGNLRTELRQLHEHGRIRMATDTWNKDWPDTNDAVNAALEALDTAISATTWMETLPKV